MDPPYSLRNFTKGSLSTGIALVRTSYKLAKLLVRSFKTKTPYEIWQKKEGQVKVTCTLRRNALEIDELGSFYM